MINTATYPAVDTQILKDVEEGSILEFYLIGWMCMMIIFLRRKGAINI